MYILHTIWLPLFSTFTTIIALPLAQSDFNIFSSDSPGSSFTSSQASGDFDWVNNLYPNNNNEQPATELFADGKKDGCKSSSVDVQANIGKRQTETAFPVQSKGSPRQLMPVPQFTSPRPITIPDSEPFLPPLPLQNPDDDKCPVELMGMSRIPVCDSGRTGQDIMRMPGFEYYTLFNIHPNDILSPCIGNERPFCCAHTGFQEHPLFIGAGPVPTGYICKNKDIEIFFREHPSIIPPNEDPGSPLQQRPFSPRRN